MDYAHNPAGLSALQKFIGQIVLRTRKPSFQRHGDRRDEDLREMGRFAPSYFDNIVIRRGHYLRGQQAIKNELVVVLGDGVPNDISIVQ
jgi:cyanophycin synthetase